MLLPTALALLAAACQGSNDPPTPEPAEVNSATVLLAADPSQGTIELTYEFEPAVEWLGSFLHIESVDRVHVIATVDEGSEGTRSRGDVSQSGELFMRFFGDDWNAE